jgi:hypothetical protein
LILHIGKSGTNNNINEKEQDRVDRENKEGEKQEGNKENNR